LRELVCASAQVPPRHRLSLPHCDTVREVTGRSIVDPLLSAAAMGRWT
jgi:hypothetical protein